MGRIIEIIAFVFLPSICGYFVGRRVPVDVVLMKHLPVWEKVMTYWCMCFVVLYIIVMLFGICESLRENR